MIIESELQPKYLTGVGDRKLQCTTTEPTISQGEEDAARSSCCLMWAISAVHVCNAKVH